MMLLILLLAAHLFGEGVLTVIIPSMEGVCRLTANVALALGPYQTQWSFHALPQTPLTLGLYVTERPTPPVGILGVELSATFTLSLCNNYQYWYMTETCSLFFVRETTLYGFGERTVSFSFPVTLTSIDNYYGIKIISTKTITMVLDVDVAHIDLSLLTLLLSATLYPLLKRLRSGKK